MGAYAMNIGKLLDDPVRLALGVSIVVAVVYVLARKTVSDAASGVGGVLSGDNAITKGTPYEGTGVTGTVAATANAVSGGALRTIGERVSSWFTPPGFDAGENLFYTVGFPDGSRGAVPSRSVDSRGFFVYKGKRYRLGITSDNRRIAVAA